MLGSNFEPWIYCKNDSLNTSVTCLLFCNSYGMLHNFKPNRRRAQAGSNYLCLANIYFIEHIGLWTTWVVGKWGSTMFSSCTMLTTFLRHLLTSFRTVHCSWPPWIIWFMPWTLSKDFQWRFVLTCFTLPQCSSVAFFIAIIISCESYKVRLRI